MNESELSSDAIGALFARCVAALNYRALRFEVRERPLALLLVVESFGRGQDFGVLDVRGWRAILCENDDKSIWRMAELHRLLKVFAQKGWLVVDPAAGTYRLRPDQWPCWAHVCALIGGHEQSRLSFIAEPDLNQMLALLSQQTANNSHPVTGITANFSQARIAPIGQPPDPVPPPKPVLKPDVSSSSFESVEGRLARIAAEFSQSRSSVDPSNRNRTHDQKQNSIGSKVEADRVSSFRNGASMTEPGTAITLCTLDGYIADKLAAHPKGERLRRELAGQSTFTAQAFQRHFERNPAKAREDVAWFLEANNPNARMNTHLNTMITAGKV